jgi:exopolysaccharide biosynthesis polyprenyl glycosylphosphotransferase
VALTDVLALEAALALAWAIRYGFSSYAADLSASMVLGPLVLLSVFTAFSLYELQRISPVEEFRRTLGGVGLTVILVGVTEGIVSDLLGFHKAKLSLEWVVTTLLAAVILVALFRRQWHKHVWTQRQRGRFLYRTAIVGANGEGVRLGQILRRQPYGFLPVGMVGVGSGPGLPQSAELPILGTVDQLPSIIETDGIECVFVASSGVDPAVMKSLTRVVRDHDVELMVSANMTEILASRLSVQPIGDTLALAVRPARLTGRQAAIKRTFDLVVGSLTILLTSPIWLMAMFLIKLTSRGSVFYSQERIGFHGERFRMYKFRTMVRGADRLVHQLADQAQENGPLFKVRNDPRLTKIGKVLRKFSIDELPQLLNVLKGDMSLVGPRPMPAVFDESYYNDWHRGRWDVLPGITGLWQVSGRSDLTFDECVALDLFYIENWSLAYDLFIILKTIPTVLFHKGAF